ncbi:MAG: 3-hydroxyacyl-[acyl-carrier-protein] dehydratase [Ulvibacter sp.]|jgi:3-hydroxyacyl-[acyl-carrier-protein] dehydratase
MKQEFKDILYALPYSKPFLFVDNLISLSEFNIEGSYTFSKEEYFYAGHFKENPVTPGVILTECMAQIGLVCFGIFLLKNEFSKTEKGVLSKHKIALANHSIDFYLPVFPGETVRVISDKDYFRFNKLKCKVKMLNEKDEVVCSGVISGMISE